MKNIAYIEIDTHAEIARNFMEILKDSKQFSVDYYLSEKIKKQLSDEHGNIFISDSSMILDQLKGKNYDLIIVGTAHRYFTTFLAVMQKYHAAVIVHNLNFSKTSKLDLIKSIFKSDMAYRLKLWWKEGLFYSSKVYKNAKKLLVLDPALTSENNVFLPVFYTKEYQVKQSENVTVVIPGGVSQQRRDYDHIFKTVKDVQFPIKATFIFLGKAAGTELKKLEKLTENLPENISIQYFSERVSTADFDSWMQKADVLWCPVQRETMFFSQKEVYGVTKMTGNLGDAINYRKPAVFPKDYPFFLPFIFPEQDQIAEQFLQLKNSQFDFHNYQKAIIQEKLERVLNGLISI